ncbi:hypothetical protein COCON_G00153550 [Conger conger]|uniref:Uncharacterized protein n=1 Tax=Conger conger TaxID=82655 RepID=A0A9Q1HUV9_CONCO|nr:hypothetical protein COCON_G00153550 [Conger conger]
MTVVLHPATPTDGTVEQKKVSSRNWLNAKPTWTVYIVLLFLLSTVSSNPIHARTTSPPSTSAHPHTPHGGDIGSGGQCALCLDPECATHIVRICNGDDLFIWKNGMLGIENCCKDNLKPDEPCQLTNGSLVVQSDQPLSFEGNDSLSGGMKAFPTETVSCAGLDLPPGPKSLPGRAAIIGGIFGGVAIGVVIVIMVRKYGKKRRDRTGPQNAAPPDGNTENDNEMSPLQGQANGNVTQGPGNI